MASMTDYRNPLHPLFLLYACRETKRSTYIKRRVNLYLVWPSEHFDTSEHKRVKGGKRSNVSTWALLHYLLLRYVEDLRSKMEFSLAVFLGSSLNFEIGRVYCV